MEDASSQGKITNLLILFGIHRKNQKHLMNHWPLPKSYKRKKKKQTKPNRKQFIILKTKGSLLHSM